MHFYLHILFFRNINDFFNIAKLLLVKFLQFCLLLERENLV